MESKRTYPLRVLSIMLILLAFTLLTTVKSAYSLDPNEGMQVNNGCMQDVAGFNLNCTAEDVRIVDILNFTVNDDGCAYPGDTVDFTATYVVELTATARHDIGLYFATDGDPNLDGALVGQCSINTLPYYPDPPWLDLDGTSDKREGENKPSGEQDLCGDIDTSHNPLYPTIRLVTKCVDRDGDGYLEVPYCASWRQPGQNFLCTNPLNAFPGAPSKCKCEDLGLNIPITVPPAVLSVVKTADPTTVNEPGGYVTFTVNITNESPFAYVDLTSLTDSIYGDITSIHDLISSTNCSLVRIQPGETYTCSFTAFIGGPPGSSTDTVTALGIDMNGNTVSGMDDATVIIADVGSQISVEKTALPTQVAEPGGTVTLSILITNLSQVDSVTITSLTDDIHGDLNGKGDCSVPQTLIANGGAYSCSFEVSVNGVPGYQETDIVTASGTDDDGNEVSDQDSAIVTITDVPSQIEMTKLAVPDQMDEPGGSVTYLFNIFNRSSVDTVTITSLSDTVYGDLDGEGDCSVPQTIEPGESYSCSISKSVTGNAGYSLENTATASGTDDDGNPVSASASEIVTLIDVMPNISVTKIANTTSVQEPGGDVIFTIVITNESTAESVVLNSLADDIYGDLNGKGTCEVPQTLSAKNTNGDSYTCSFTGNVSGEPGSQTDTVTAIANDDDGNSDTATDDETVTITDVMPDISVTKTAEPKSVPETGGDVTYTFVVTNNSTV